MGLFDNYSGTLTALGLAGATLNPVMMGATALGLGSDLYNAYNTQQNFELQKDMFKYQKDLQKVIFAREDNSVQRRVADLKAAGLSPVLAAGSGAGAGAIVQTKAPQRENIHFSTPDMILGLIKMQNDIETSVAQRKLIEMQTSVADATQAQKWHDYKIYEKSGQPSNGSAFTKTLRDVLNFFDSNQVNNIKNQIKSKVDDAIGNKPFKPNPTFDSNGRPIRQSWMDDATWDAVKNIRQNQNQKGR